jgi:signal transduction histidine kinase
MGGVIFASVVASLFHRMVFSLEGIIRERTNQLERVHAQAIETERETQRLKDHFVFVAAHEIRTPVTAMRWCLDLIDDLEKNKRKSTEIADLFERMRVSLSSLISLVDDLLDTSRIEYGTFQLKTQRVAVGQALNEAVGTVRLIADREGSFIEVDYGDLAAVEVTCDPRRVSEVLVNLLTNAVKFSPAGSVITVSVEREGEVLLVKVRDDGVGLSDADMGYLFKKFSRPDNHHSGKVTQSTGLGLYIAKTIVERWGGRIWAESGGRGTGSTFCFTLPL